MINEVFIKIFYSLRNFLLQTQFIQMKYYFIPQKNRKNWYLVKFYKTAKFPLNSIYWNTIRLPTQCFCIVDYLVCDICLAHMPVLPFYTRSLCNHPWRIGNIYDPNLLFCLSHSPRQLQPFCYFHSFLCARTS